jgi:hypothetical protein
MDLVFIELMSDLSVNCSFWFSRYLIEIAVSTLIASFELT